MDEYHEEIDDRQTHGAEQRVTIGCCDEHYIVAGDCDLVDGQRVRAWLDVPQGWGSVGR
jgi:hypothetical protein